MQGGEEHGTCGEGEGSSQERSRFGHATMGEYILKQQINIEDTGYDRREGEWEEREGEEEKEGKMDRSSHLPPRTQANEEMIVRIQAVWNSLDPTVRDSGRASKYMSFPDKVRGGT